MFYTKFGENLVKSQAKDPTIKNPKSDVFDHPFG